MRRTARRLVALLGAAVLLVLALAAGPAAAAAGSMMIRSGRNSGFIPAGGPPTDGTRLLMALVSVVAIALVAVTVLALDRRSGRQLAVAEGPTENADRVCDDVACDWRPSRPEVEERRAA